VALFALHSWVLLCFFRSAARSLVGVIRREFGALHYVLVVGTGASARRWGAALERSSRYGIRLAGLLADQQGGLHHRRHRPQGRLIHTPADAQAAAVPEYQLEDNVGRARFVVDQCEARWLPYLDLVASQRAHALPSIDAATNGTGSP
jgi:hypothetical protein